MRRHPIPEEIICIGVSPHLTEINRRNGRQETTITSLNAPNYKFTMPLSSLCYYMALRYGLSPRSSPLTSMTESCNLWIIDLALLQSCVKWGALPEYWSAEHSPHYWSAVFSGSVRPMMTTLPELFTSSTSDDFMAYHIATRRILSTKTSSRLIWCWRMLRCSINTMRAGGTRWLS